MLTHPYFDAANDKGGSETPATDLTNSDNAPIEPIVFDEWLKGQDKPVKEAYETHVKGLKGALTSERQGRQELEKQLRELAKKAEAGSEAQTELVSMADKIKSEQARSEFYEAAHDAGVSNLKLAYLIAVEDGFFDSRGNVNFKQMQEQYPELFGGGTKPKPKTHAGSGSNDKSSPVGMNQFIRAATGRTLTSNQKE